MSGTRAGRRAASRTRTRASRSARPPQPAPRRRGTGPLGAPRVGSRMRADLRLSWRQVLRAKGSSILVTLLVALPVAGLFGAAVFLESRTPTPEEAVTLRLGQAQAQLVPISPLPDGYRQAIDEPSMSQSVGPVSGDGRPPMDPPPTELSSLVPASAQVIPIEQGVVRLNTRAGIANFTAVSGDAWDPALRGAFRILSGRAPTGAHEAMAGPGLLGRLGIAVGDRVALPDSDTTLTITGALQAIDAQKYPSTTLYAPAGVLPAAALDGASRSWFVTDWQPRYQDFAAFNREGYGVYARDVVLDPPPGAITANSARTPQARWTSFAVGAVFAVASGFLVTLLAGAAFAVAARRQQRSLAVAASVGATRGDLFRIVVLQGLSLGLAGGVVGAVLGGTAVAVALRLFDPGVQGRFWSSFAFRIPWDAAIAIIVFAALVGTLSALAPARTATRGDTLGALRGARRPAVLRRKAPVIGIVLVCVGAAVALAGGVITATVSAPRTFATYVPAGGTAGTDVLRGVALWMMIGGPILLQIGIILTGHALLRGVARLLSPLGLAPRLAARDAAANPTRTVPAFTAITASVFIATFVLAVMASTAAVNARQYPWSGPLGSVSVTFGADGADAAQVEKDARQLLDGTDPRAVLEIATPKQAPYDPDTGRPEPSELQEYRVMPEGCDTCRDAYGFGTLTVADADAVKALFGNLLDDDQRRALRDGALLTTRAITPGEPPHRARIDGYPAGTLGGAFTGQETPTTSATVPLVTVPMVRSRFDALITPATAARLGIPTAPLMLVGVYDTPPDTATIDRLTAEADGLSGAGTHVSVMQEDGPTPIAGWLTLVAGVAGVIVLGSAAISLGLSRFERRPDDATLAAVGAHRVLRRNVNAWQAVIIAGLGALLGVLSGLVPAWSMVLANPDNVSPGDLPLWWLAALAVGLPLLIAGLAWLVRPRRAELTHRTAIA
ncbi:FtsX-like permease family protein [Microbacterium sp. 22242]|uniref:FtsX-like permease family protein n=1 Tax=Microbacterium sp. 22242 TaxID=3453896 RepID=UPI003F859FD1